jgi:hypothetical protein
MHRWLSHLATSRSNDSNGGRIDVRRDRCRVRERQTRGANAALDGRIRVERVTQRGDKGADQTVARACFA